MSQSSSLSLEERMRRLQATASSLGFEPHGHSGELLGSEGGGVAGGFQPIGSTMGVPSQLFVGGEDSEDQVGVVLVEHDPGVDICGGWVGRDKSRFCCAPVSSSLGSVNSCGVEAHTKKAPLACRHAYIRCLPMRCADTAYVSPSLDYTFLPDTLLSRLTGTATIEHWSRLFSMLASSDEDEHIDEEQVEDLVARQNKSVSFMPTTPGKRLKLSNFPELEDTPSPPDIKLEWLSPTAETTGDPYALVVANWNKMVDLVDRMRRSIPRLEFAVDNITAETSQLIEAVDSKVSVLYSQAGAPPKGYIGVPAPDLWGSVRGISSELSDLWTTVTTLNGSLRDSRVQIDNHQRSIRESAALRDRVNEIHNFVGTLISEVSLTQRELLNMQNGTQPGGHGDAAELVSELLSRVGALERKEIVSAATNDMVKQALTRIGDIEIETGNIKSTMGGDIVRIDDRPFHTPDELQTWVEDHMGGQGICDVFFDFTSMLETLQDVSMGSTGLMGTESVSSKAGHTSLINGRILSSFATTVPDLFNAKTTSTVPFSRIPTYKSWDARDHRQGLVPDVKRRLIQWKEQHKQRISQRLQAFPQAKNLANNMLSDSINFWQDLVSWIEQFYGRLTANEDEFGLAEAGSQAERRIAESARDHSHQEAWNLILKILDDLFQEMALRRSDGISARNVGVEPARRAALTIYASLRAHKFMKELSDKSFERHPVLTPTFNGFLFLERASHASVKRVSDRVEVVAALATSLQGRLDRAAEGGGRGSRGGDAQGGRRGGGRGAGAGAETPEANK